MNVDLRSQLQQTLGDAFRLERELGGGGMSRLFEAEEVRLKRKVAIKVLSPELAQGLSMERFEREIQMAAALQQANIVPVLTAGETNGLPFYTMPFVDGESLRVRLSQGPLAVTEVVSVLRDVSKALAYAHRHGVVHRDIKPDNVLLSEGTAVVTDFGIAKAISAARTLSGSATLTQIGTSIGTPAYMAPEQAAGDPNIDHRADIYSLGAMAYELLAGHPVFPERTPQRMLAAHVQETPRSIAELRADTPAALAELVMQCLAKNASERPQSAADIVRVLETITSGSGMPAVSDGARDGKSQGLASGSAAPAAWSKFRRPTLRTALVALALVLALSAAFAKSARVLWARSRTLPALQAAVERGDWESAYLLAVRLDAIIPSDSTLAALRRVFADTVAIDGTPKGARVYRRAYSAAPGDGWEYLGKAPIARIVLPRLPVVSQFKFEADGYATGLDIGGAASNTIASVSQARFALVPVTKMPPGMVRVDGALVAPDISKLRRGDSSTVAAYFLDRFEVTNEQYQLFVDSGGYQRRELWEHAFFLEGRQLTWEEGIAKFVDRTGRPGPATWEAGRFPRDKGSHPVGGVSWYEAAAYAKFRGKRLPSVFEWWRVAKFPASGSVTSASNIERVRDGTAPVGSFRGIGGFGTMDMAGNVREWCFNESRTEGGRFILGGGFNDPEYTYYEPAIRPPFDRSDVNGFRLALNADSTPANHAAFRPIELSFRDYKVEKPVGDEAFKIYRSQFAYDPALVHPRVERRDSSAQWILEKVSYDAAYGGERVSAYVYLPRHGRPPYQAAIFFPGSGALTTRSSDKLATGYFDFLVDGGRAVIFPVYKSTFERGDEMRVSDPDVSNAYKDHVIMWEKDVSRTLDYLGTRADMDTSKVAYLGMSWGGRFGGLVLAIEPRFKAAVLNVAGLNFRRALPEADDLNYLPRVHTPVLMINGRYDFTFPLATSAEPMYGFLGTPAAHKRHVIVNGVHYVPRQDLIRETLGWLDRYLGPVK